MNRQIFWQKTSCHSSQVYIRKERVGQFFLPQILMKMKYTYINKMTNYGNEPKSGLGFWDHDCIGFGLLTARKSDFVFANEIVLQFVHHLVCICAIASTALVVRGQHKEHLHSFYFCIKRNICFFLKYWNIIVTAYVGHIITHSLILTRSERCGHIFFKKIAIQWLWIAHKCSSTY